MATVAETMNEAARKCRVEPPSNWVSATDTTSMDFKDVLAETVDELLERIDWPDPITQDTTISGTGVETYSLPAGFKRLTRDMFAVYETTTTRRAGVPITTNGDWTYIQDIGSTGGSRYYRLSGNEEDGFEISFYRFPATGDSITVSYVSKNWLSIASVAGSDWSNVSAVLLLPKYLVLRGVVWRFRRDKGLPYADRLNEYEADLSRRANDLRGVRRISMTPTTMNSPFDIPVPDYIPPA
jgi:hypothetical protein